MNTLDAIAARRSVKLLSDPAPNDDQLRTMFEAAAAAPDHKNLRPWQFIVLRGDKKDTFGEVLANALKIREPEATEGQIEKERSKPQRAPLIVVAVARRMPTSLPFEELYASTCAATQNLLLAATDMGFGSMWRSGDAMFDDHIREWLGLTYGDAIVGFIYLGTATSEPVAREQISLADNVIW